MCRAPFGPNAPAEVSSLPLENPAILSGGHIVSAVRGLKILAMRPTCYVDDGAEPALDGRREAMLAMAARMQGDEGGSGGTGRGTAVITRTRTKTKKPSLYRVLLLNDDYTPMEFVIHVLERFFQKNRDEATRIMLHVHNHGVGECGVFTYEIAETKVTQVMDFARQHQHPLQCVMEKK
jgi:ATP-dependent Clp protease adaptor protein ClpS